MDEAWVVMDGESRQPVEVVTGEKAQRTAVQRVHDLMAASNVTVAFYAVWVPVRDAT